jgi:prephenate dehydrogenase
MDVKVAILGGTGSMGQWFAKYYHDKGFEVIISGRTPEKTARIAKELGIDYADSDVEAVRDANMVIVSHPIEVTAKSILETAGHLKKGAILFDIASVKGDAIEALEKAAKMGVRAISIHPLYGPGAQSIRGKQILMIPINEDVHVVNEMTQMFEADGGIVHVLESGAVHDKMMALTLGLPHLLNIIFGKAISEEDIRVVKKCSGTTFALQLLLTESVLSQDPNLYYAIQSQNPAFQDVLNQLIRILEEMASAITTRDKKRFITTFEETKASISRDSEFSSAYQRFYRALDVIRQNNR